MRYVLTAFKLGPAEALHLLDDAADAFDRRIVELEAFQAANTDVGTPSLDALDLGIRLFRTRLQWCRDMKKRWGEKK